MGRNKKKKAESAGTGAPDEITPWNAILRLPERQKYRVLAFLVWLLGMFIILWVFRN